MRVWTAYVRQEGDDLIVPFPEDLLETMGWKEGDVLVWDVREDGCVVLTKKATWYNKLWSKIKLWRK